MMAMALSGLGGQVTAVALVKAGRKLKTLVLDALNARSG
jgi:hypothetical protein